MSKQTHEILAFNRGIVSPLLMGRIDVQRTALSAAIQSNFVPHSLGPMSLRPGLEFIGGTRNFEKTKHIPFVFSNTDTALLELTDRTLRIRPSGGELLTVPAVTTTIVNSGFNTDLSGWTSVGTAVGTAGVFWDSGTGRSLPTGGYARFIPDVFAAPGIISQTVTPGVGNVGVQHRVRVVVSRGVARIQIGVIATPGSYADITVPPGVYSIAFTPLAAFAILIGNADRTFMYVDSCAIETVSAFELPTPWTPADLSDVRFRQSGDVVYVANKNRDIYTISRGLNSSWSVAELYTVRGPFRAENTSTIEVFSAVGSTYQETSASFSQRVFSASQIGARFTATVSGQAVSLSASPAKIGASPGMIKVEGAGTSRNIIYDLVLGAGTVGVIERALDVPSGWAAVITASVSTGVVTYNDGLDNRTVYYRVASTTNHATNAYTLRMYTAGGRTTGHGRIIAVDPVTSSITLEVYAPFSLPYVPGPIVPLQTTIWSEGSWSAHRGYPACVALRDARLWAAGKDKVWASVVDDFANFDPNFPGDAGPINRSIGEGPVESLGWMVSAQQLIVGGGAAEWAIRSTSRDEPITPFNFNIRPATSLGSSLVDAVALDTSIIYVDKSGSRVIEFTSETGNGGTSSDLTLLPPQIGLPGVINLVVQRRPDARIHAVRSDGKVAMLLTSKTEDVRAWVEIETDGFIEEAVVLPGNEEDQVFYVVQRNIAGVGSVRYLEKWAKASECLGGQVNKQADSFVARTSAPSVTVSGLSHLNGEIVDVWADGIDQGQFTVAAGIVTLPVAVSNAVAGLHYTARFKSTKLARTPVQLVSRKRISKLSVLLANTHAQGLRYGDSFSALDPMPLIEEGGVVDPNFIWGDYNYDSFGFNGTFTVDSRLCLEAASPRPCTVLAVVIDMEE